MAQGMWNLALRLGVSFMSKEITALGSLYSLHQGFFQMPLLLLVKMTSD
jgi:hypothetical protein